MKSGSGSHDMGEAGEKIRLNDNASVKPHSEADSTRLKKG